MAPGAAPSRSRAPPAATPPAVLSTSKIPLSGMEFVIDLKGISDIPSNLNEEPLRSQRLLLFEKGSTLHVPNVPGAYVTNKPFKNVVAPCMATFSEASGLEDQLVLAFADHSMASCTMSGVGIITLDFPLKVRHNVYKGEKDVQIKSMSNVVELYPIDTKNIKYIDLNATLKHYHPLSELSIQCPADAVQWVAKKLGDKVPMLHGRAVKNAETYAEIVRATDARAATTTLARHTAQLEQLVKDLEAIGYDKYDRRLSDRIQVIDLSESTTAAPLEWISTPMRGALASGQAKRGDTALKARRTTRTLNVDDSATAGAEAPAPASSPQPEIEEGEEDSENGADKEGDDKEERGEDDDESSDDENFELLRTGKRTREAPKRFEAVPVKSKQAKKAKGKPIAKSGKESKKSKTAEPASAGTRIGSINPRTGRPYKREPYSCEPGAEFAGKILGAKKNHDKDMEQTGKVQRELTNLAGKLADALQKLKDESMLRLAAEAKLAANAAQLADAIAIAVKDERISNLSELHTQFMDGMKHGAMMARGDMSALMPAPRPPSHAASSSAGVSESPSTAGIFGQTPVASAFNFRPTP